MHQVIYDKYPSIDPSDVASAIEYILKAPQHVNVSKNSKRYIHIHYICIVHIYSIFHTLCTLPFILLKISN